MSRHTKSRDLSLKWLKLFQICAQKGSLQAASEETGLTVSTISHHLKSLEDHLGVELFNHSRRPMTLTPKGLIFLRNIDGALLSIRKAEAEASAGNIAEASYLRIGATDDFESDIIPELAVSLSRQMPRCDFLFQGGFSYDIVEQLRDRKLDLGITASPSERLRDLDERPLLRDPFVVVLKVGEEQSTTDIVEGRTKLPFLRFTTNLIISRQIESHLRRTGISTSHRFECSNNQTLMAMVAAGVGWTITTPFLFARAKRFHSKLRLHPFPAKSFARTLSIVSTPDCSRSVVELVNTRVRGLLTDHALDTFHESYPWLSDKFMLID